MNTEQIKTFLALVETGSFSRTAESLFVSQSTVSKRIHELEHETGCTLFNRGQGGVKLTEAGMIFFKYAQQILTLQETAHTHMHYTSQYDNYLVLGTVYAYYDMHLWESLKDFSQHYPRVSVRVKYGHSGILINELRRTVLDLAFTHAPLNDMEYVCRLIGSDAIVLVTDEHNSEYQEGINYDRIKDLALIDSNFLYMPTYRHIFPQPYQFQLKIDIAAYTVPLLYGTGWYTLLPEKLIAAQLAAGTLRKVPVIGGDIPPVQHYVIYKKEKEAAVSRFLTFVHGAHAEPER